MLPLTLRLTALVSVCLDRQHRIAVQPQLHAQSSLLDTILSLASLSTTLCIVGACGGGESRVLHPLPLRAAYLLPLAAVAAISV
jgi:hypothetical protein